MSIDSGSLSAFHRWLPASWLQVAGSDALTFLQGQLTQDVRLLERQPAVYGLWLTVKGKVLADSFVLRGPAADTFWVGSYFSPAATIRERLEGYIIADDVTLEDVTTEYEAVSLFATGGLVPPAAVPEAGWWFPGRRGAEPSLEWVFPKGAAAGLAARWAGLAELSERDLLRRRIAAGLPAVPVDVGPADLPNEGGLDAAAISYTKGCYLGQEVMARLKSMGQVRRRLLRVHGPDGVPATPQPLFAGERQVGELRSAVDDEAGGWSGLALLSLLHLASGTRLALAAGGPAVVDVMDLP